jgi:outer membrane protein assembly factor BamE
MLLMVTVGEACGAETQPLQWFDHIVLIGPMTAPALSNRLQRLVKTATFTSFAPRTTVVSVLVTGLATGLLLTGCSTLGLDKLGTSGIVESLSPYRMEVVQGNFVSKEQAAALKPGMARAQVRDILGTPLLTSVFHGDRWDYVFTIRRQGATSQVRHLSVFFKGDTLDRFEGDELPSETEFVAQLESSKKLGKAPPLEANAETLKKFAPASSATPPTAPPGVATGAATGAVSGAASGAATASITTAYPPLEGPAR